MSRTCQINKEILNEVIKADADKDAVDNLLRSDSVNETTRRVVSLLQDEYKIGDVVDMDYIDEKFIKKVSKKELRKMIRKLI